MQLVTYADRLAGDLRGLESLLVNELRGLFDSVHILPFFESIDGADAGFDPSDHTRVDARLGGWDDIRSIASTHTIMADLIVNHVSADSREFQDVQERGSASPHWDLFLKKEDVFPDNDAEAVAKIYRPRPGPPFTPIVLNNGKEAEFWTTFSPQQLDINVESESGRAYLTKVLETFASAGIGELRLDAAGYAIKKAGTSCFMLPETFEFIGTLSNAAQKLGMKSLVEIHSYYQTQVAIASRVGLVYDFALPPLVLHALYSRDASPCKRWLEGAPRNCITVLDTHDGIGIVDVAGSGKLPGLLTDTEVEALVEGIHERTGGASSKASGYAASNLDVYQVNTTFYDALARDDVDYLMARAIQFFAPGTPQVYYVGLLAGENDTELVAKTGVGRDINRHYYSRGEVKEALQRPVVQRLMELMRLRSSAPAFHGEFSMKDCEPHQLVLRWDKADDFAELFVDLQNKCANIFYTLKGSAQQFVIKR